MDLVAVISLEVLNAIACLILISLGLAIIFGLMRVINLAHGEFMMLGAYAAIVTSKNGLNVWISILIAAPVLVGIVGFIAEYVIIRHLYGRMVDCMLATWGLGLFLIGLVTTVFGNTTLAISAPLGGVSIGAYRISLYTIFLILIVLVLILFIYSVLRFTRAGLIVRGTMQNPAMAGNLGVNPSRVYSLSFTIGAALTGLAGALLAPISGAVPTMGAAFIAKAFITVVSGGASILTGTASASAIFGIINQIVTFNYSSVLGEVALLIAAVILLRILPQGITARFFKRSI